MVTYSSQKLKPPEAVNQVDSCRDTSEGDIDVPAQGCFGMWPRCKEVDQRQKEIPGMGPDNGTCGGLGKQQHGGDMRGLVWKSLCPGGHGPTRQKRKTRASVLVLSVMF